jgi:hypothetical protein
VAVIDGANSFITLEKLRGMGYNLSADQAIQSALQGLKTTSVKLVLCEGEERSFSEELLAVKSVLNGQLQIITASIRRLPGNQSPKVIKEDDLRVRQIIHQMIEEENKSQLLIFFSGDQHLAWPLKTWLRSPIIETGQPPTPRQLVIVSSRAKIKNSPGNGFVSSGVLEVANHPNAVFRPLEGMCESR